MWQSGRVLRLEAVGASCPPPGQHVAGKADLLRVDASANRMALQPNNQGSGRMADDPIPFPAERAGAPSPPRNSRRRATDSGKPRDPTNDALAALANVSRRINDLARELKCLGFFDDGEDRPRAA